MALETVLPPVFGKESAHANVNSMPSTSYEVLFICARPEIIHKEYTLKKLLTVMLSGLLIGIDNTTLIVQVSGKQEKLPLNNLLKVVIEKDKEPKRYALYGMLFGVYMGNFIFLNANGHPTAYAQDISSEGFLLWNLVLAGAGGGLGLLAGSAISKGTSEFKFPGKIEDQLEEWEQLKKFILTAQPKPKRFRLSVQASRSNRRVAPTRRTCRPPEVR